MKRTLTPDDIEPAVFGGAILGGGGGGFVEPGLRTAALALRVGGPELWSVDEFDDEALTATVALVGAPAAPDALVRPAHLMRALDLLSSRVPGGRLAAVNTNENGAETTVNGWFHAALSGMPVIDVACNGRAHPTSVMGAMGLHLQPDYTSIQAFAGGRTEVYVEGVTSGRMEGASGVVRRASIEAGGWVGVARNPVTVGYAAEHGATGAISFAINLGRVFLDGGLAAVTEQLGGRIVGTGTVSSYTCEQVDGLDVGRIGLTGPSGTTLLFVNEYMLAEVDGERVGAFPDLIMTFDENGKPLPSARVSLGQTMSVLVAPASSLKLASTMFMPDLYLPLEKALGIQFAPRVEDAGF